MASLDRVNFKEPRGSPEAKTPSSEPLSTLASSSDVHPHSFDGCSILLTGKTIRPNEEGRLPPGVTPEIPEVCFPRSAPMASQNPNGSWTVSEPALQRLRVVHEHQWTLGYWLTNCLADPTAPGAKLTEYPGQSQSNTMRGCGDAAGEGLETLTKFLEAAHVPMTVWIYKQAGDRTTHALEHAFGKKQAKKLCAGQEITNDSVVHYRLQSDDRPCDIFLGVACSASLNMQPWISAKRGMVIVPPPNTGDHAFLWDAGRACMWAEPMKGSIATFAYGAGRSLARLEESKSPHIDEKTPIAKLSAEELVHILLREITHHEGSEKPRFAIVQSQIGAGDDEGVEAVMRRLAHVATDPKQEVRPVILLRRPAETVGMWPASAKGPKTVKDLLRVLRSPNKDFPGALSLTLPRTLSDATQAALTDATAMVITSTGGQMRLRGHMQENIVLHPTGACLPEHGSWGIWTPDLATLSPKARFMEKFRLQAARVGAPHVDAGDIDEMRNASMSVLWTQVGTQSDALRDLHQETAAQLAASNMVVAGLMSAVDMLTHPTPKLNPTKIETDLE